MGLSFQSSGRWVETRGLAKPLYWIGSFAPFRALEPDYADSSTHAHAIEFGNVAFTPDLLQASRPIHGDRPYASLLYLDTRRQAIPGSLDPRSAFTSELSIGMLGLEISEHFQRWLHKKLQDSPTEPPFPPEGWDNQISDGGELTARYMMRWQGAPLVVPNRVDVQWIGEGNLGYHTNLGAGAAIRLGLIASPWWQFEPAPIAQGELAPSATQYAGCGSGLEQIFEFFGWAGTMARLWGYNVMLQGQFRDSAVTVDSSDVERLVYDYSVGATAGRCFGHNRHRVSLAYARRSPEFDSRHRRYHSWGGIYYSITFQ
jgi:hypothetical protein